MSLTTILGWGALVGVVFSAIGAAGAVVGAVLGPQINNRLPNAVLQGAMGVIVAGIGVKYLAF